MSDNQVASLHDYRILIIDHSQEAREQATQFLEKLGFPVVGAENFGAAQELLQSGDYSLILSELDFPSEAEAAEEFLKWMHQQYNAQLSQKVAIPFLAMTAFSNLFQYEELDHYPIQEFLIKPLEEKELTNNILRILKIKNIEGVNGQMQSVKTSYDFKPKEKQFCKVLLSDFTSLPVLQMDIYVQLAKDKFVRIARRGEKVSQVRFSRYKEKGISHLFIRKEEFKKVVDFNLKLNKALKASPQIDLAKKKRFMVKAGEIILEHAFVFGLNKETFNEAKDFLITSMTTLLKDDEKFSLVEALNEHSDTLYAHSLGVSLYSVLIARAMGWERGDNLFKLAFAGLFHDIGKKDFDPEILAKPNNALTFSEKELLETHPERGREVVQNLKNVPAEVISAIYEHHENMLGQGYPRMIKKNRIHPMARIIAVADDFCYFAIKNPDFPKGTTARKALEMVEQYRHRQLDSEVLFALRKAIMASAKKGA